MFGRRRRFRPAIGIDRVGFGYDGSVGRDVVCSHVVWSHVVCSDLVCSDFVCPNFVCSDLGCSDVVCSDGFAGDARSNSHAVSAAGRDDCARSR